MDSIYKQAHCDGCNKILEDGDTVVALIPNVKVDRRLSKDLQYTMRLKLSTYSLDSRTVKVYCNQCLELNNYLGKET